jgi:hypothetical protein
MSVARLFSVQQAHHPVIGRNGAHFSPGTGAFSPVGCVALRTEQRRWAFRGPEAAHPSLLGRSGNVCARFRSAFQQYRIYCNGQVATADGEGNFLAPWQNGRKAQECDSDFCAALRNANCGIRNHMPGILLGIFQALLRVVRATVEQRQTVTPVRDPRGIAGCGKAGA